MEWKEYVQDLLNTESEFDDLTVSLNNESDYIRVPSIIKASILLLDDILNHKGKRNIFVFPEKNQTGFLFTLMKLLHNICQGKIQHLYDPNKFHKGERLKLGNAVVEFLGTDTIDGKPYIRIKTADTKYAAPFNILPQLQHTDTSKRLSPFKKFIAAKKELEAKNKLAVLMDSPVAAIESNKSHMESSIFYMAPILNTKTQLMGCSIDNEPVLKIMMVAQANFEGAIQNIGPGQIKGVPAIVLSSDLYSIEAAIERGNPVQSLILDISNETQIEGQLDVLDRLCLHGFPILCYTDTASSINLGTLVDRGFNIWRWDETSLTSDIVSGNESGAQLIEKRLNSCAKNTVSHVAVEDSLITDAAQLLFSRKNEVDDMTPQVQKVYERLSRLIFAALREACGFTADESKRNRDELDVIEKTLSNGAAFISPEALNDYRTIVGNLRSFFDEKRVIAKHAAMVEELNKLNGKDICIVIPEHSDKGKALTHWHSICLQNKVKCDIVVYYPSDFLGMPLMRFEATIIVGWFRRDLMRKMLLSYKTPHYSILLYPHENRWCRFDERRWHKAFQKTNNQKVVRHFLSTEKRTVTFVEPVPPEDDFDSANGPDELGEFEKIIHEGKYKRFSSAKGQGVVPIQAYPVNFVGDFVGFYRPGHTLISATRIITEDADRIQNVLPDKLNVGDFVVVREADRDLIREIADRSLINEGKVGLREMSGKWRESLQIELLFTSFDDFYTKLKAAGCTKSKATVANWCNDEDMIAPQDKEDLRLIAEVSDDMVLRELLDVIYDASREVKAAHTQAGMELSTLLRTRIADELKEYGDIDPFNIWEPIEMDIEGIGLVRILKVIDVNDHRTITVDSTMTDHLMSDD